MFLHRGNDGSYPIMLDRLPHVITVILILHNSISQRQHCLQLGKRRLKGRHIMARPKVQLWWKTHPERTPQSMPSSCHTL
jgi:hypothetical protein